MGPSTLCDPPTTRVEEDSNDTKIEGLGPIEWSPGNPLNTRETYTGPKFTESPDTQWGVKVQPQFPIQNVKRMSFKPWFQTRFETVLTFVGDSKRNLWQVVGNDVTELVFKNAFNASQL
ncbi:hypothetical protein NPIL_132141 [Nephila pilipes]|uniref:Uncharacterized protein n=1 Tax=Nephila pilipes TaxID=299642 RepID=A0A8X6TX63_NEPPI|nr:hypothetical protein NPIL_132141 [Nephila pilipes]